MAITAQAPNLMMQGYGGGAQGYGGAQQPGGVGGQPQQPNPLPQQGGPNYQVGIGDFMADQVGIGNYPGGPNSNMGPQQPQNGMPPPPPPGMPGMPMPPKMGSYNPYSPHAPLQWPQAPGMQGPGGGPNMPGMPGAPDLGQYGPGTQFGGQSTVNAQANPADYDSVRGFADQAYQQSMRNLQPQMDSQNRRFDQELINKGLDPSSEAGKLAADQLARNQNDLQSKASFDALQFGQGMQQQMFGQDLSRSQLAGQMQMGQWGNNTAMNNALANLYGTGMSGAVGMGGNMANIYGSQLGLQGNMNNNATNRYQSALNHQLGMGNLDLSRQQQDWNEYNDLEGMNQWEANFNRTGDWRNQDLMMAMMGMGSQMPGGGVNGSIGVGAGGNGGPTPAQIWGDTFGQQWDKYNTQYGSGGGS